MDYIIVPILLIFGFGIKSRYPSLNSKDHILIDQLFFYHMIISFIFYIYITVNGGDALHYWNPPKEHNFTFFYHLFIEFPNPTQAMWLINFIPSNLLNLSFFSGCILYGLLGHWGMVYLILTIKKLYPNYHYLKKIQLLNIPIFPIVLFMPNLHFWSSGVGKDTISFYVVCAAIYVLTDVRKRWYILLIPSIILYIIRPHILLFVVAGFAASYLLKSKLFAFQKVFLLLIGFAIFLPFLNNVLEFANIEDASLDSIQEFNSSKSSALSAKAGSGVDLGALPYPLQVLTFLFRPLYFDANNVLALLASVENTFWLFLTITFLNNNPLQVFKKSNFLVLGSFLYWLIGALAFAPVMSNLGIIIRERNMFLPGFILVAVAGLYNTTKFRKFNYWLEQNNIKWNKKALAVKHEIKKNQTIR